MRPGARRRAAWAGLTGLLATTLTVLSGVVASPASALTTNEVYARPASGVFAVKGHGWGHGRGMSQWGAQGGAKLGKTGDQITAFYYPHTTRTTITNSSIRVQLRSNGDHAKTAVYPASGLYAYDLASKARLDLPSTATRWRITVDSTGYRLGYLYGSTWTTVAKAWTGPLQFQGTTFVRLAFPDGTSRDYRGAVRSVRTATTTVQSLAVMPMESYLLGVVPRESPSGWATAALQAQSIAARSYSAYERAHAPSTRSYDICDTTACQVFGGSRSYTSSGTVTNLEPTSTTQAVQATANVVRADSNGPIFAEFSSSNGGWSTDGGLPYLVAQRDDWDGVVSNSVHSWDAKLPVSAIESHYGKPAGSFRKLVVTSRDGNGEWGGRVTGVTLTFTDSSGTTSTVDTTGRGIYNARTWPAYSDGLKSSWWWIVPEYASTLYSGTNPAPTLVLPPGTPTGTVTAVFRNSGSAGWPVSGLHLAVASPAGGADPLVHNSTTPGTYVANLTTPGATVVAPGELAKFQLSWDATGLAAGTRTAAYRVQVGRAALFGGTVSWKVVVQSPVFTAALGAAPALVSTTLPAQSGAPPALFADHRTVVVPRDGSTTVRLTSRNTGNASWPAGSGTTVRLGTSGPRNRTSASYGPSWYSAYRPSLLEGSTAVAPGANGTFSLQLYGGGNAAGLSTESFEPVWDGYAWLAGDTTSFTVVRVDTAVPYAATTDLAPASSVSMPSSPNGTATLVVRLRNLGGQPWDVGSLQLGTSTPATLANGWPSSTRTPPLRSNVTRPGATKVYPGEVGQWYVPLTGYRHAAGTYAMTLRAVGPNGAFGPSFSVSASVRDAVFTGSLQGMTQGVVVPSNGTKTVTLYVKNTGNFAWPVGGMLRTFTVAGSSPSYWKTWISASRPGPLASNYTRAGATSVAPGEVGRFTFVLAGNGRPPQSTSEAFGFVWDGWKQLSITATLPYRVQ